MYFNEIMLLSLVLLSYFLCQSQYVDVPKDILKIKKLLYRHVDKIKHVKVSHTKYYF